ncbi:MAG: glycosyltransferase family 39 protein [Armatimonadetes bacterium]|nr:glycosyltransferase family 39 protein [Armatimonadota bacterium]MDW8121643.1 glycosyltransferase family 39 protein [Armatimonadota bacterium]
MAKFSRWMKKLVNQAAPSVTLWVVVVLGYLPVMLILRNPPALMGDEAYYARCPLEMSNRGDFWAPYFNGQPRFKKPPLCYWTVAAAYRIFGISETTARMPSLLAVILTALLLSVWATRESGPALGQWSGPAFLLMPMTALLSQAAIPEATLTLLVTASCLSGWLAFRSERGSLLWTVVSGAAMGLAFLCKALPGFLPLLILFPLVIQHRTEGLKKMILMVAVAVAIGGPWLLGMHARFGKDFWEVFLFREHLQRVTSPLEGHSGPVWYYLPVVLIGAFPWSLRLVSGWVAGLKELVSWFSSVAKGNPSSLSVMGWISWWLTVVLLLFSLTTTKLPHYIFPALPAVAWLSSNSLRQRASIADLLWIVLTLILGAVSLWMVGSRVEALYGEAVLRYGFGTGGEESLLGLLASGLVMVALLAGVGFLIFSLASRMPSPTSSVQVILRGLLFPTAALFIFAILMIGWAVTSLTGGRSAVAQWAAAPEKVTFGPDMEWAVFYSADTVPMLSSVESLVDYLKSNKEALVLARVDQADKLRKAKVKMVRYGMWVVGRRE